MWSTEREMKKEHEWWESCFNSSLCFGAFIPFISYLFLPLFFPLHLFLRHPAPCESHTSFPFLSATLPPFHFSSLASCLYHSPLSTFYLSIHSPRFAAKNSPYISEVHVSFIFSCWLIHYLSVSTMCHPFH